MFQDTMFQATCGTLIFQPCLLFPGPLGSFMRHVTTMKLPTNPSYVTTLQLPVNSSTQLRTDRTFENIAAHQAYLERLQLEQNTLRSWSNMIQDPRMGEADQVHNQKVRMVLAMQQQQQQQQSVHPWTQEWADRPVQPPTAHLAQPVQPTVQPLPVPVKPALARHQAQPASSSMSGARCRSMGAGT